MANLLLYFNHFVTRLQPPLPSSLPSRLPANFVLIVYHAMERPCRSDIVTPSGVMQRVTTEYFLGHVLPQLPSGLTADGMLATIRCYGKKSWRIITQRGRWRGFPSDPVLDTRDKQSLFIHFAAIVDAIFRAGSDCGYASNFEFVQHLVQEQEEPDAATLPDGCVVPLGGDRETWEAIAAFGWYSKSADCEHSLQVSLSAFHLIRTHTARRPSNGFNRASHIV